MGGEESFESEEEDDFLWVGEETVDEKVVTNPFFVVVVGLHKIIMLKGLGVIFQWLGNTFFGFSNIG